MRFARPLLVLLRVLAGVLVILGIGFWTGHWPGLVPMHRVFGTAFVLILWALAGLALAERRATRLAVFAIAWGAVIAAFGFTQQQLLVGDLHWIVRVLHLIIALAALPLAERLTRAGQAAPAS